MWPGFDFASSTTSQNNHLQQKTTKDIVDASQGIYNQRVQYEFILEENRQI